MARNTNPIPTYRKLSRQNRPPLAFVDIAGQRRYVGEYGTADRF